MTEAQRWTGPHALTAVIALCGALLILIILALIDAYAIRACFRLAYVEIALPEVCGPEHLLRTSLEIGGMAIGLYGVTKLIRDRNPST